MEVCQEEKDSITELLRRKAVAVCLSHNSTKLFCSTSFKIVNLNHSV